MGPIGDLLNCSLTIVTWIVKTFLKQDKTEILIVGSETEDSLSTLSLNVYICLYIYMQIFPLKLSQTVL